MAEQSPSCKKKTKRRSGPLGQTCKYLGVSQYARTGRWEAHIWDSQGPGQPKGRQLHLGSFPASTPAAIAYDRAAWKIRPDNAIYNFPNVDYSQDPFIKEFGHVDKMQFVKELRLWARGPELAEEYGQPRVPVRKYGGHSGCAGARKRQRNTDHMMSGPDTSDGSAAGSYHAESGTDAANPRRSARLLNTSKVNYQDVDPEVEDSLPSLAARMEDVDVSSGGWYYPGEMSSQGSQWGPESSMQPYRIAEGVLYNGCPVVSGVALFPFDRGHNTRGTPEQGLNPQSAAEPAKSPVFPPYKRKISLVSGPKGEPHWCLTVENSHNSAATNAPLRTDTRQGGRQAVRRALIGSRGMEYDAQRQRMELEGRLWARMLMANGGLRRGQDGALFCGSPNLSATPQGWQMQRLQWAAGAQEEGESGSANWLVCGSSDPKSAEPSELHAVVIKSSPGDP